MHLDSSCVIPYNKLMNIDEAVKRFDRHFGRRNKISILIDEDVDGFTSAAMMYSYIKQMDNNYPVEYIMQNNAKAHGLTGTNIQVPPNTKLIIIPDAATNDCLECNRLYDERDIEVIILDHHQREKTEEQNKYAIIVNNQISPEYANKDFCGAGIVYKFLQALDDFYWQEYADDYLDLVALANISDVMDMRSYETKYITEKGLRNIKNKCFKALIDSQDFSIKGHINIHNIQWYITPIINGCIRFGSKEEKELLFRALIETDESFEYKKRAGKGKSAEVLQESIYDRSARLCKNAKSRQDKSREKCTNHLLENLCDKDEDKVIIRDVTDEVDTSLTGVVAIKIAEAMNKPCILLKKRKAGDKMVYGGSARNINHSPIQSLKDVINSTGVARGQGHGQAFGIVDLPVDKLNELRECLNVILRDVEYDATYECDFIVDFDDISLPFISKLTSFDDYLAQGISEPILAIENICLRAGEIQIVGKNMDTYKFVHNDIEYVRFKVKPDEPVANWIKECWDDAAKIKINIVGKPKINIFNGIKILQIIILDANIVNNDKEIYKVNTEEEDIW